MTVIEGKQIRDFDNRPLRTGWPLNTVLLCTSWTVFPGVTVFTAEARQSFSCKMMWTSFYFKIEIIVIKVDVMGIRSYHH